MPQNTDATAPSTAARLASAERLAKITELLVAGLIHDLRTPLMAINLSAEVALARTQDDAVRQAVTRIRSSSERMGRLFDHLLNLSRIGAEVSPPRFARADLGAIVDAVLDAARRADPHAHFEVTRDGELGGVFDQELVRRSLANFVSTALEHAGDERTVTIHLDGTHRDRLWVRVSIVAVIAADVQERMFVRQAGADAGLEAPGLGLGLNEVDGLVRAHGGSVVGRSRAPGGTVFEMLLPRDCAPA